PAAAHTLAGGVVCAGGCARRRRRKPAGGCGDLLCGGAGIWGAVPVHLRLLAQLLPQAGLGGCRDARLSRQTTHHHAFRYWRVRAALAPPRWREEGGEWVIRPR